MRIDVALLPGLLTEAAESVCVVVDALRDTSAIATLFARGVEAIAVTATIDEARGLKQTMKDRLLCGESGGLPPEGFDYGNSPAEFSRLDLAGRRAILATSNGTRALVRAADAPVVFTGSLLNRTAAARAALAEARDRGLGITFLCAGTELGEAFSLEDTAVCGALVEAAVVNHEGDLSEVSLTDSAMAAYRVWRSYSSPRLILGESQHGRALVQLGLSEDLDFCAQEDLYDVTPRLERDTDGLLTLRP